MTEESDQAALRDAVIDNSKADTWNDAKKEWKLVYIFDLASNCVCGHAIVQNCVIRNTLNSNELIVGNVCINHFQEPALEVPDVARNSLRGLNNNTSETANEELLKIAFRTSVLTFMEKENYTKITTGSGSRVRFMVEHERYNASLTAQRDKINRLIKLGFSAQRPICDCGRPAKPRINGKTNQAFYSCYNGRFQNKQWTSDCKFSQNA